jgi:hypothetical protein
MHAHTHTPPTQAEENATSGLSVDNLDMSSVWEKKEEGENVG